jgi:hypothetical protein
MPPAARAISAILAFASFLIFATGAPAQQGGVETYNAWQPTGQATLAVTTATARVALGSRAPVAWICNTGAVTAFVAPGTVTVVATVAGSQPVLVAQCIALAAAGFTHLAAITSTSTAALLISTGLGHP